MKKLLFSQPKFIKYSECLIVFVDIECNIGFLTTTIIYEASITLCNYCPHFHATPVLQLLQYYMHADENNNLV